MLYVMVDGYPERQNGPLGVLKQDLIIGKFNQKVRLFRLPKGIVVRDASAVGADYFEPHRFKIIVTSNREDLVDYDIAEKDLSDFNDEFYSAK
ncbi:hypothetical protein [Leptospira noguchii]|uniref:Uncharacterized protein n=1 Tax=Leptospira noguchii str. 2001034031 TaxID=1193053 RepID=M6Y2A1_9LEPT|nr:hypothetical protein [Leptospira noguchii]EMO88442.1 hypothetical protein LEP1GSC024_1432 [Leptospira noguchii str. 2001034031]